MREGVFPRKIDTIVLHCTDTRPSVNYTVEKLQRDHKARGFGEYPGYHFYIRRDGTLYCTRPLALKGCHVAGHNAHSIGVCYEGGHREDPPQIPVGTLYDLEKQESGAAKIPPKQGGRGVSVSYEDNRTEAQKAVLLEVLTLLRKSFPEARIVGHHDLNPNKACPCFDAKREYASLAK